MRKRPVPSSGSRQQRQAADLLPAQPLDLERVHPHLRRREGAVGVVLVDRLRDRLEILGLRRCHRHSLGRCPDHARSAPLRRPPRHGRLLRVGRAAAAAGAEGEAGRRLRLGAAGGGDHGQLRGAQAGRDPLGDAGGGRPPAAARRRLPAPRLRRLPGGLRRGDGDPARATPRRSRWSGSTRPTSTSPGLFSPKATMRRIASEIREETGLTCSIGISESRMLAKITSELGKPAGLVVLSRAEALERFAGESPGPDPRDRAEDGRPAGADGDPHPGRARRPRRGRAASRPSARAPAAGCTAAPASKTRRRWSLEHETKSQSTEITFDVDVADREAQAASIVSLAEELCRRLRSRDLRGRTIGIKVRLDDWTNVTRSRTVEQPTNDPALVTEVALDLLRAYSPPRPVRLLGVRVAQFGEGDPAGEGDPEGPRCGSASRLGASGSAAGEHDAEVGEAQALLGRLGQVEVAAADVGAAVDDRHGDRAAAVAQPHPGPAGQRTCGRRPACPAPACRRRRARRRRGRGRSRRRRPAGRR